MLSWGDLFKMIWFVCWFCGADAGWRIFYDVGMFWFEAFEADFGMMFSPWPFIFLGSLFV